MKAWKTIAAAGAVLALAAPAANASFDKMLPSRAPHAKKVVHHHVVPAKVKSKNTGVVIMIIGRSTSTPYQPAYDATLDCENTGNNCTDEQLCVLWGMNCDLVVAAPPSDATAENENPTG